MSINIELKAKCENPVKIESLVKKIATEFLYEESQTDTYFNTKEGRFKLRESDKCGNYLIPYFRDDNLQAKQSEYMKIFIENAAEVKNFFSRLWGIKCVVNKKRKLYEYYNVRIHLDHVHELGNFIEFEAVCDEDYNLNAEYAKIDYLQNTLQISKKDLIQVSYAEMLISENS